MDENDPRLDKARQAAGGRNADLARLLGISPSAISQWVRVPYRRALQIEARTAGRVTRAELRPDLFGAADLSATGREDAGMSGIGLESFPPREPRPEPRPDGRHPDGRRAGWTARSARTRAVIVAACRTFMQAGQFRPPLQACCSQAGRSISTGFQAFGPVEVLHLEAADDPSTRDAIVERVLGCERAALSAETLDRLVRALVTGAA